MKLAPSVFYYKEQKHLNLWWQGSIFVSVLLVFNIFLYLIDHRLLGEEALWIKPIKFEISMLMHLATLTILASLIKPEKRDGIVWKGVTYLVVGSALFEGLYIFLQAARVRESHFNSSTTIETVMYGMMGVAAVTMILGSMYLGFLLYREYKVERNSVLLLSSSLGLMIGSILTIVVASYLATGLLEYPLDETTANIPRMPIFAWYLDGGDLRIAHFFATHMIQFFPLYGLYLSRKNISFTEGRTKVLRSAGIYTFLILLMYVIAIF